MERGLLPHMVDDQDLVGQVQHEIALVIGAWQLEPHRLELEYEIVAESAIKPELGVLGAGETLAECAQQREHAGLAAALLLRKPGGAFADLTIDAVRAGAPDLGRREVVKRRRHGAEQKAPALVQGLDRKNAIPRRQDERRVDKPHIPTRIAAGKLEAR